MNSSHLLPWLPKMSVWLLQIEYAYKHKALDQLLAGLTPSNFGYATTWREAEAIRDASGLVVHHLPRPNKLGNCLAQSLLRYTALRRRGFPVAFHLGLRREGEDLSGHAWLTLHGERLWEENDASPFQTTFRYP